MTEILHLGVELKVPSGKIFWPKAVFYLRKITEGNFNLRFAEDGRPKVIISITAGEEISISFETNHSSLALFVWEL